MADSAGAAFDAAYLEGYTGGDAQVIAEVLALFQQQAALWLAKLEAPGDGWRDLAHTIKGSAKGIGAHPLGDLAGDAEHADASHAPAMKAALKDVLAEIEAYLSRAGGG